MYLIRLQIEQGKERRILLHHIHRLVTDEQPFPSTFSTGTTDLRRRFTPFALQVNGNSSGAATRGDKAGYGIYLLDKVLNGLINRTLR